MIVSDKLTQNAIDELEGTLQNTKYSDTSILQNLLDKIPDGIFGGGNKKQQMQNIQSNANAAQMQNMSVSPRNPEEFTRHVQQIYRQIMPAIEFHDEVMMSITGCASRAAARDICRCSLGKSGLGISWKR